MMIDATIILYSISNEAIIYHDVSGPRGFFDRLRSTKELAYDCQGKVELSFSGYDDDPRELYEIKEVREYVRILSPVLNELFFFSRTTQPTGALLTFSLCHTHVIIKDRPHKKSEIIKVAFESSEAARFFAIQCRGLKKVTDWLSIPEEEATKIALDVAKCIGLDKVFNEHK